MDRIRAAESKEMKGLYNDNWINWYVLCVCRCYFSRTKCLHVTCQWSSTTGGLDIMDGLCSACRFAWRRWNHIDIFAIINRYIFNERASKWATNADIFIDRRSVAMAACAVCTEERTRKLYYLKCGRQTAFFFYFVLLFIKLWFYTNSIERRQRTNSIIFSSPCARPPNSIVRSARRLIRSMKM